MKKLITICVMLSLVSVASATIIINFDDLPTDQSFAGPYGNMKWDDIPLIYQGLQWTPTGDAGWNVNDGRTYMTAYGNTYGAVSANNFASNSGVSVTTVSGTPFDFVGAYFSTWAQNDQVVNFGGGYGGATSVTVNGYNGATLEGTVSMNLSSTGFDWLAAGFQNITRVEILGGTNKYWIMDNFTIPEPATICLLGLGALSLIRRKR